LSKVLKDNGVDVALDDEAGVYQKVPIELFYSDPWDSNKNLQSYESVLNTKNFGKSLGHRTFGEDNDEMRWVIQRASGHISTAEFRAKMGILAQKQKETSKRHYLLLSHYGKEDLESEMDWIEILYRVVEETIIQSVGWKTHTADIFIADAIFKSHILQDQKVPSAIERASIKLHSLASDPLLLDPDASIGWGNTNTKPRDYSTALEAASKSNRPIYFIPFANPDTRPGTAHDLYLPHVGLEELFRRNVKRLMATGRYVPSRAIIDACLRVNLLLSDARDLLERTASVVPTDSEKSVGHDDSNSRCWTPLQWNKAFALLAGYDMLDDGTVVKIHDKARSRDDDGGVDPVNSKRIRTGTGDGKDLIE
jgi:hypothetical protein